VFLLSGTPITNKPYDVLQQLVILERVTDFGGFWAFAKYYCNAQEVWRGNKKGWDFSGALHLEELNTKLREMCYIRREKTEVLKDLPEKTRDYLPVDIINRPEYERAVLDIVEYVRSKKGDEKARAAARAQALVKISVCRQIAAAGKRWAVVSWVKNFLETTNEKIVLFGWHKDAILDLMGDLAEYINDANLAYYQVAITGETDAEERNEVVRLFQEDPECRILIANIQAGGVGLTLTAASKILFFEFGWTPAEMAQAEDRIYRIGQKNNCVIYYMFARQTIDEHFIKMLADKKAVVDQATDGNFEYIYDLIEKESLKYGTRTNEFEPEWPASYGEYDSAHDYRTLESSDSESQGVEQEEDIPDL
jgi:SWI/SNF-related matrix-associated actin-dependent regulator 1 of chromatin subfamily A